MEGLHSGKITSLPNGRNVINFVRHFSHRHDSYPEFPRSPLGTAGTMGDDLGKTFAKKSKALLESRSAKAGSTKKENVGINDVKLPSTKLKMRLDGFIHQTGKYVRILGLRSHKPRSYCSIWFGLNRTSWKSILPVNEHRQRSPPLSLFVLSLSASRLFPGGKHNTSILWRNYLQNNRISFFGGIYDGGVFLCILALFAKKNCKLLTALLLPLANNKKQGFDLHRHAIYPRRRHKRHAQNSTYSSDKKKGTYKVVSANQCSRLKK